MARRSDDKTLLIAGGVALGIATLGLLFAERKRPLRRATQAEPGRSIAVERLKRHALHEGRHDQSVLRRNIVEPIGGGEPACPVQLRLIDLDWKEARIRVSGKGRQQTLLPLTQEIGDANRGVTKQ